MATALDVIAATWEPIEGSEFLIEPLDGVDMLRVADVVHRDDKGVVFLRTDACITLIRHGLKGWKSFPDAKGNEVPFVASMDINLKRLPFSLVRPLATAILAKSSLGAEDEKN